jgi:deoxyribodipyrimidine photo-lyase
LEKIADDDAHPRLRGDMIAPAGEFARPRVPALARPPNAYIHRSWRAGVRILAQAGVRLDETYPARIVDQAKAQNRALAADETSK